MNTPSEPNNAPGQERRQSGLWIILPICAVAVGIAAGLWFPGFISSEYTTFFAVGIVAAFDSILGGLKAVPKGTFRLRIFLSGFLVNIIVAVLITYMGYLLSLDLYLAIIVVFGTRIFKNLAQIRKLLLKSDHKSDKL